jgi:hypothetical protein
MNRIRTIAAVMLAAGLAIVMTAFTALAASEFEGVLGGQGLRWKAV